MRLRNAFTMLELIFVIVVMGIIGKFGVEFLAKAYENYILSTTNNQLQAKSASAVEFIATRLQHRIKDSVIVRTVVGGAVVPLASAVAGTQYRVLEWVQADIDGFRGHTTPLWSGILDLDAGILLGNNTLVSPGTNTVALNDYINALSNGNSGIGDAALYFIGSNSDVNGYGWGGALTNQSGAMHPIQDTATADQFTSSIAGQTFAGVDVYEYYQLSWTANAIIIPDYNNTENRGTLQFCTDYQPWNGDTLANNAVCRPLADDISTFQAMAIGSIIKIQVCANSELLKDENGEYSLCKEKTIY